MPAGRRERMRRFGDLLDTTVAGAAQPGKRQNKYGLPLLSRGQPKNYSFSSWSVSIPKRTKA